MNRLLMSLFVLVFAVAGCKKTHFGYEQLEPARTLTVSFLDKKWDGVTVPAGEQCRPHGGQGSSPALKVSGLPAGTTAVIVEFNDRSYAPLASGGGHGAIMVSVPAGAAQIDVPAVPTETNALPAGVTKVASHRGDAPGAGAGAYLAPCSGGRGNVYVGQVHAVNAQTGKILAQGAFTLGRY